MPYIGEWHVQGKDEENIETLKHSPSQWKDVIGLKLTGMTVGNIIILRKRNNNNHKSIGNVCPGELKVSCFILTAKKPHIRSIVQY